jgi:hypothetical protein
MRMMMMTMMMMMILIRTIVTTSGRQIIYTVTAVTQTECIQRSLESTVNCQPLPAAGQGQADRLDPAEQRLMVRDALRRAAADDPAPCCWEGDGKVYSSIQTVANAIITLYWDHVVHG